MEGGKTGFWGGKRPPLYTLRLLCSLLTSLHYIGSTALGVHVPAKTLPEEAPLAHLRQPRGMLGPASGEPNGRIPSGEAIAEVELAPQPPDQDSCTVGEVVVPEGRANHGQNGGTTVILNQYPLTG